MFLYFLFLTRGIKKRGINIEKTSIRSLSSAGDPGGPEPDHQSRRDAAQAVNSQGTLRGKLRLVEVLVGWRGAGGRLFSLFSHKAFGQSPYPTETKMRRFIGGMPSAQMLMSLTSVGVQDRSSSSSTRLVSVEMLCC